MADGLEDGKEGGVVEVDAVAQYMKHGQGRAGVDLHSWDEADGVPVEGRPEFTLSIQRVVVGERRPRDTCVGEPSGHMGR
jgi:hypothetical protein